MSILRQSLRFLRAIIIGIFIFSATATATVIISGHSDQLAPLLWPLTYYTTADEPTGDVFHVHEATIPPNFPTQLDDLIIVAHYDDECIAVCQFLKNETAAGKKAGVVVVTFSQGQEATQRNWYGEKRHFNRHQWRFINFLRLKPTDRSDYALTREAETNRVLDRLGVAPQARLYLHYPELTLEKMMGQPNLPVTGNYLDPKTQQVEAYHGAELKRELANIITRAQPKRIITHFTDDTHTDHRTISRLISEIIDENTITTQRPEEWQFLVHWSHADGGWVPEKYPNETTWLTATPSDFFQIPEGSPAALAQEQITIQVDKPTNIASKYAQKHKQLLLSLYETQIKFDPEKLPMYAKKNELFWDIRNKKVYNFVYSNDPGSTQ